MTFMSRPEILNLSGVEKHVVWLLRALMEDGEQLFLVRLTTIVDELERLLQAEPGAKSLVTAYVASVIGDLSILAQCLRQLELYQPWSSGFESHAVSLLDDIKSEFAAQNTKWAALVSGFRGQEVVKSQVVTLGDPTGGRFE